MKKYLILMMVVFFGCTDDVATKETLEKAGYSNVETLGYDVWACSEDDDFSTKFRAKNPKGQTVTGVVCCGMMKSCTIRF